MKAMKAIHTVAIHAVVSVVTLLLLDLMWVAFVMRRIYGPMVQAIQGGAAMQVSPWKGAVAYGLMVVGLVVFVVPAFHDGRHRGNAIGLAALYGFLLYGVYNFTASAILSNWRMSVAALDVMWGTFVFAVAPVLAALVLHALHVFLLPARIELAAFGS